MYVLMLNRAMEVVHYYRLSEGGISGTVADIRLAFVAALKSLATSIILAHNHLQDKSIHPIQMSL